MAKRISRTSKVFLRLITSLSKIPLVKALSFFLTLSVRFLVRSWYSMADLVLDRMPPQIGDFIAQTVYPSEGSDEEDSEPLLKSSESHPLADAETLLCHFVNVPSQQVSQGTSWKVSAFLVMILVYVDSYFPPEL